MNRTTVSASQKDVYKRQINTGLEEKYQSTRAYDDFFFEPVNVWDLSNPSLRPDINSYLSQNGPGGFLGVPVPGFENRYATPALGTFGPGSGNGGGMYFNLNNDTNDSDQEEVSPYFQATWKLSETWNLVTGARLDICLLYTSFLALMLFRQAFDLIALIGVFLLIGIVKKNAIMMIDFAIEAEREEGLSPGEAIFKACQLRFRPILMTTMAAILGAVPLAIGYGDGAELRQPLGISIVGGLIVSQMLTLYTTPVVYLYIDRARLWLHRAWVRLGIVAPDKDPAPAPI